VKARVTLTMDFDIGEPTESQTPEQRLRDLLYYVLRSVLENKTWNFNCAKVERLSWNVVDTSAIKTCSNVEGGL